jgi:undecaprenyl-diphosphatase
LLAWGDLPVFSIGLVTAFASALLVVRWLILYVAQHSFVVFAWYRIAFGALVLLSAHFGWLRWA